MQTESITVTIDDLAFGGDGVARDAEGKVVFVPFTAVGDRVEVTLTERHKSFSRGRGERLLEPGAGRTEPGCPYYGFCGGCCYQHLDYGVEVAAKAEQLQALLTRVGGFADTPCLDPVLPGPQAYGYRNKMRLEPFRTGAEDGDNVLHYGYCARDNETLFEVDRCPIVSAALNDLLPVAKRSRWGQQNETRERPRPLTLRETAGGETQFYFGYAPRRIPWLTESLGGTSVRVPLGAFWQVNPPVAEALVGTVAEWITASPCASLVDCYCGVGTFSLILGQAGIEERFLIESDQAALEACTFNHNELGLAGAVFLTGKTAMRLPEALGRATAPATVILDPPRTGCDKAVLRCLADADTVRQLVYVSCNASTLARDLARLRNRDAGFVLERLALFDMFPRTAHFETAALLRRV